MRKPLRIAGMLQKWDRLLMVATAIFIALILLSASVKDSRNIVAWIANILLLGLVYLSYSQKDLHLAKPVINSFIPLILISIVEDAVKLINPGLQHTWENYFDVAETFGFVWMGAMLYISGKQRKALEKERLEKRRAGKKNSGSPKK